jgi:hypothetical protein
MSVSSTVAFFTTSVKEIEQAFDAAMANPSGRITPANIAIGTEEYIKNIGRQVVKDMGLSNKDTR